MKDCDPLVEEQAIPRVRVPPLHIGWWTDRDEIAMSAMTGILAKEGPNEFTPEFVATRAYEMADAMLKARQKETHV